MSYVDNMHFAFTPVLEHISFSFACFPYSLVYTSRAPPLTRPLHNKFTQPRTDVMKMLRFSVVNKIYLLNYFRNSGRTKNTEGKRERECTCKFKAFYNKP